MSQGLSAEAVNLFGEAGFSQKLFRSIHVASEVTIVALPSRIGHTGFETLFVTISFRQDACHPFQQIVGHFRYSNTPSFKSHDRSKAMGWIVSKGDGTVTCTKGHVRGGPRSTARGRLKLVQPPPAGAMFHSQPAARYRS
ncbi:MAG TPA: hypothetical protein PLL33_06845 [Paracoccus sp. (in: a-proteobacteria)]|nr:hypothetical protein [Paracoccus sp. (in: a-proteobacteria)]